MGARRRLLLILAVGAAPVGAGCRGCTGIDDFALDDGASSTNGGGGRADAGTGSSPTGDGGSGAGGRSSGDGGDAGSSSSGEGGDECLPCYSGPPGTEDEGTCRGGSRCGDGECEGEVVPLDFDDCVTVAREDCEAGAPASCTGAPIGHGVITENDDSIFATRVPVASDAAGRTVGATVFTSATYFDGTPLTVGTQGLVVWGLDASLQPTWRATRQAPADTVLYTRAIAMEGDDVVVASTRIDEVGYLLDVERWTFGAAAPASTRTFANPSFFGFAVDQVARAPGVTYVVFNHDGAADLDGDGVADGEASMTLRGFLAALDDAGGTIWSLDPPNTGADLALHSVAVHADDVWVTGMTVAEVDLGCPAPVPADSAFLAAFDAQTGGCRLAEAVLPLQGVVELSFQTSSVKAGERGVATMFSSLVAAVHLHDRDGAIVWTHPLGVTTPQALAMDPFGHVAVVGTQFDGETSSSFARRLDVATGEPVWPADVLHASSMSLGFSAAAARPDGSTVVGGTFTGETMLESVAYEAGAAPSSFFYALAP